VVDLETQGRIAGSAGVERPFAPGFVAGPDRPAHLGGDVIGLGGTGDLTRPLRGAAPLGLVGEEQVEGGLDDLLGGRAGLRVGLAGAGGLELVEELLRDRHV